MNWQVKERKKLGRPIEGKQRKERVNFTVDSEVVKAMDSANINKSKFVNSLLREAFLNEQAL